jgi:hypothetical protein
MSGVIVAALAYGPQILALVQGLVATGVAAEQAWSTVSSVVSANRAPTPDEWAAAGLSADQAHAAVQGL